MPEGPPDNSNNTNARERSVVRSGVSQCFLIPAFCPRCLSGIKNRAEVITNLKAFHIMFVCAELENKYEYNWD